MNLWRSCKGALVLVALLSATNFALEALAESNSITVADSVMEDIAFKIAVTKNRYMVFSNFDPASLSRNADGFKELRYSYPLAEGRNLEVNVIMISSKTDEKKVLPGAQVRDFPLAGVKVLWSTVRTGFYLKDFDLGEIVENAIWPLEEVQQKQLPIRISIETPKTTYKVGEPINVDLVIKNVTNANLRIKPLGSETAYCVMNGQEWGTKEPKQGPSKKVLRVDEESRFKLKMSGIRVPGDFKITCSYGIGFQGIRPAARKILKVE